MDTAQFWRLIEQSRQGAEECEAQTKRLTTLLQTFPPKEIVDFDRHFAWYCDQAYRWDLWAVAYIINGGCSDDGFEYFRRWLIGQGQTAYEAALANPESVADLVHDDDPELDCESLMYAADYAYEKLTGEELPAVEIDRVREPRGKRWEENDLEVLYPRLCAKF